MRRTSTFAVVPLAAPLTTLPLRVPVLAPALRELSELMVTPEASAAGAVASPTAAIVTNDALTARLLRPSMSYDPSRWRAGTPRDPVQPVNVAYTNWKSKSRPRPGLVSTHLERVGPRSGAPRATPRVVRARAGWPAAIASRGVRWAPCAGR